MSIKYESIIYESSIKIRPGESKRLNLPQSFQYEDGRYVTPFFIVPFDVCIEIVQPDAFLIRYSAWAQWTEDGFQKEVRNIQYKILGNKEVRRRLTKEEFKQLEHMRISYEDMLFDEF